MSDKRWLPGVLEQLGVARDGNRWVIPTATGTLRYSDNGARPKMLAQAGMERQLWPRPEDTPGPVLIVVEGEPDAISGRCLGLPTVALPGAGKDDPLWPARLATGRKRTVLVCDCDATGRARMRELAKGIAKHGGNPYIVDIAPDRDDGYDLGDLLSDLGPAEAQARLDELLVHAERFEPESPTPLLPRGPTLRVLDTLAMLTTKPPPLDWLADGVFCRSKLTLFGGREKRGKSLVQLALAVCMASGGGECAGIAVKKGRVLLLDAENGERETHRRLRALGLEPAYAENLTVVEVRGFELRDHLDEVKRLADEHLADLVLLDSFRALWRGDERDEAEVAAALDPLRELAHDSSAAYALTHHAQKGGEEYRGSSAIGACIDWCCMLDRTEADPMKARRRRLTNPLARIAAERDERWLTIVSGGDEGPVSLTTAAPYVPTYEAPKRDEIKARVREIVEGCGGVDPLTKDHTTSPSWTTADLARALDLDPKDWTLRQAVEQLRDEGLIYRNDARRWERTPNVDAEVSADAAAEIEQRSGGRDYSAVNADPPRRDDDEREEWRQR